MNMAYVNVAEWNPEHVSEWIRGLDDEIQPYTQFFVNNKINGCQLLTLARDDLNGLNMTKTGHQELVLEAVEQLRQLHYNLTSETLQSLALKLGCKAQSLYNDLKRVCQDFADTGKKERVSAETLSAVSDIINLVKSLICWLDRYPFVGQENYSEVRKIVLKLSVELASTAQRDQFADNPHGIIKETCSKLTVQSDKIVQDFNDSLIIQPASLEVAKVKRKADDDLGIHINSLYSGIHIIESIKFQSPAYRSGKVEEGDEIVQVNYQTVVGWQVKNIICAMREHPSEVHLTLKKRPRHPNVLGQVITLWPYRIPSKKTALRKLYKWSKGKEILCPKSPGTRGEANSVSEANGANLTEKEKQFSKPRKLRRRATVTGVSPTSLFAPVSLEELVGSNSRRKDGVLRTISYDPNKTIDLEDNVFKRDLQSGEIERDESKSCEGNPNAIEEKTKSTFLRPPQEKFGAGHLRRQEALKNSETVARAGVASVQVVPGSSTEYVAPPKPPLRIQTQSAVSDNVPSEMPSGNQSPKQKFAEWVNRQRKKPEGLLQHALTIFSPDSSRDNGSSLKDGGSPKSPKGSNSSPKTKKNGNNIFQFPFREGRPSLSELRSLKKTANSKVFSERVNSNPSQNSVTSPKQSSHKRNQVPPKKQGMSNTQVLPPRHPKPQPNITNGNGTWVPKQNTKITDSYIHPNKINYAKIPQYPCEMHESKIVSLKGKTLMSPPNPPQPMPRNSLHYQRIHQMSKLAQERSKKPSYNAFYSPSGRSLSFNNIAASSSDESSSDEEDFEIYEDASHLANKSMDNGQAMFNQDFTRQLTEMYNTLSQRQQFLQRGGKQAPINPASKAIIDELALRMYHALQMNHLQSQQQQSCARQAQSQPPQHKMQQNIPRQNGSAHPRDQSQPQFQSLQRAPKQKSGLNSGKNKLNSVLEHPVDLPPSYLPPPRLPQNGFKSATSQEIHNLYTSQMSNKSSSSLSTENDKSLIYLEESSEKEHMYETIPYKKSHSSKNCDSGIDMRPESHEEKHYYPAEKEFEPEQPSKDSDSKLYRISPKPMQTSFLKDNTFCPIKEKKPRNIPIIQQNGSAFKKLSDTVIPNKKNIEPAISALMMSIPKPPLDSFLKKSSSSQTEYDICDTITIADHTMEKPLVVLSDDDRVTDKHSTVLNDDSFNCRSISDSLGYSSNSSLSSSGTVSSSGSCYYYVERCSSREDVPLIDLRSPTLPTMGITMIGKKRCPSSSSGSEHGSNCASRASPNVVADLDGYRPSRIVTDVEHTI